jgi:hypothetical protein
MTVNPYLHSHRSAGDGRPATGAAVSTRRDRHRGANVLIGRPWVSLLSEPGVPDESPVLIADAGGRFPFGERRAA